MLTLDHALDLKAHIGTCLGTSDWVTVSQEAIDQFALLSGDDHWIHVDVAPARPPPPPPPTLPPGPHPLSLIPALQRQIYTIARRGSGLNYGYDRLRFLSPVCVDSRIRLKQSLVDVARHALGTRLEFDEEIEIEGGSKPALVARHVLLIGDP